jgi:hypothetical protein
LPMRISEAHCRNAARYRNNRRRRARMAYQRDRFVSVTARKRLPSGAPPNRADCPATAPSALRPVTPASHWLVYWQYRIVQIPVGRLHALELPVSVASFRVPTKATDMVPASGPKRKTRKTRRNNEAEHAARPLVRDAKPAR